MYVWNVLSLLLARKIDWQVAIYAIRDRPIAVAGRADEYSAASREQWAQTRKSWMQTWPSGTRYDVRCLDGGAWDRSTNWGAFATLEEALRCAQGRPAWRQISNPANRANRASEA